MTLALQKTFLSGQTDGSPILITDTSALGQTLHQAVAGTGLTQDRIIVSAVNLDSITHRFTAEIGGNGISYQVPMDIPPNVGPIEVFVGHVRNGIDITGFADASSVINVFGTVVTGTPSS